jgi:hypothetical protein
MKITDGIIAYNELGYVLVFALHSLIQLNETLLGKN